MSQFDKDNTSISGGRGSTHSPLNKIEPRLLDVRLVDASGQDVVLGSCTDCKGSQRCFTCNGTGVRRDYWGKRTSDPCRDCEGTGVCWVCRTHLEVLAQFGTEFRNREFGIAEATLIRALNASGVEESMLKNNMKLAGLGGGALVGALLLGGPGTIVGSMVGNVLAERSALTDAPAKVNWKQADLFFCLGLLYASTGRKGEASQAWIKALTLKEDHQPSRMALKENL